MRKRKLAIAALAVALPATLAAVVPAAGAAPKAPAGDGQFVAVANSDADYSGLKADLQKAGARVVREMPEVQALVARAPKAAKSKLAASVHAAGVATDHLVAVSPPESTGAAKPERQVTKVGAAKLGRPVTPDPAYFLPGTMWNEARLRMTQAFRVTTGSNRVTVGVADTGLDYTHSELATKVVHVEDFSDPTVCPEVFEDPTTPTDADLAADTGGPADGDFNGHGSWIGGNIAGALDGTGINGIAPKVGPGVTEDRPVVRLRLRLRDS